MDGEAILIADVAMNINAFMINMDCRIKCLVGKIYTLIKDDLS